MISFLAFLLSDWILSSCGHSLSSLNRNSGPFHHLFLETNSLADIPCDGISAGFISCMHSNFLHSANDVLFPRFEIPT